MQLTQIRLAGFKSFVDPVSITVPGQLVAVVGPNGCGKSNVIDAVRWVLGESSAKQLRGQNMQDVIFNGATTRKPVSRAMVELVFDNSKHQLQGSWGQYAEVAIKRVLTRQGESSYYINGQTVRRRDITDLFLGTGVGARGYAVIEQGMISRIIEARPEELRSYLEEAAGVSRYKERRRETQARLVDTEDNLSRLHDMQTELSRQMEKLTRQASIAARYQELTQTLKEKQNLLTFIHLLQVREAAEKADLAVAQGQTELARIEQELTVFSEQFYQLQLKEHDVQQNLHQVQNQWALVREQRVRLEEKMRYQQQLQQRLTTEKQKTDSALEQMVITETRLTEEIAQIEQTLLQQQTVIEAYEEQLAEIRDSLPQTEQKLREIEAAHLHQNNEKNRMERQRDLLVQQLNQLAEQLNNIEQRKSNLAIEKTALNCPDEAEILRAQQVLMEEETRLETLEEKSSETEQALADKRNQLENCQQQFQRANAELAALEAQIHTLRQLSQSEEQHHAHFWQENNLQDAPVLWQSVEVSPIWQDALNVFLGERLYARHAQLNAADCTPQTQTVLIDTQTDENNRAPDTQFLRAQVQAEGAFALALDIWLAGIRCAPDMETALQARHTLQENQAFITPQGHIVDRAAVFWRGTEKRDNQLLWAADIARFTEQQQVLLPQLEQYQHEIASLKEQITQTTETLQQLRNTVKNQNQAIQTAQQLMLQLQNKQVQAEARNNQIAEEALRLTQQQEQIGQKITQQEQVLEQTEEALNELIGNFQDTAQLRVEIQQQVQDIRARMYEMTRQQNAEQINEQKSIQLLASAQKQLEQTQLQYQTLCRRQDELNLEFDQSADANEPLLALEQIIENQSQLEETLDKVQNELQHVQADSRQLQNRQNGLTKEQQQKQQLLQESLLAQQQAKLQAEKLQEDLEKNHAQISGLQQDLYSAPDPEKLSAEIVSLAQNIERLGAVNLVALEELEEAKERYGYFEAQREDLVNAMNALKDAIGQIDEESRQLFQKTFDVVNEKIREYFPTLFGGGQAYLELVGEDMLDAGVSIMAHPPGKKNSTIHLLSGGEKALTAMSLIFALFSLNPAPFCLLDEVDAPLDDSNTSRFCQLVQKMSTNTQFLYISHNRITMEMADQLIGVTMQEKGVSRIVSVDIQQALSMREGAD